MNKFGLAMFSLAALSATDLFAAEPCCRQNAHPKWYAGLSGGVVFLGDSDYRHGDTTYPFKDYQTFKAGYSFAGQVGYRVFPNIRTEFEVAYRTSDVDESSGTNFGNGSRTRRSIALMTNAYYDLHNRSQFTPYVGAGIGAVNVKSNRFYGTPPNNSKVLEAWTLGYQFMGGITYEMNSTGTPFEISLGYRYVTGEDAEVTVNQLHDTVTFSNDSHNVELGARIFF